MKKYILLCLPLLCVVVLQAQPKTTIDVVLGGDYHNFQFSNSFGGLRDFPFFPILDKTGRTGFRVGFNLNRRLHDDLSLRSGLRYFTTGYQYTFDFQWPSENNNGQYEPSLPDDNIDARYHFLEIPLMIRLEFGARKWQPYVESGLSVHVFLASDISRTLEGLTRTSGFESNAINKMHVAAAAAAGIQRSLGARHAFFAQPVFRYGVSNFAHLESTNPSSKVWSIGLETGVRLGL